MLTRLALLILGVTAVCAIGEIGVRELSRFHEVSPAIYAPAPDIPWQLKPGARSCGSGPA